LISGDHGRDQVVNIHYMLSKALVRTRPSVLWCYKKELGFTSHRQKRMRKIKREIARGIKTQEEAAENPFELFVSATDIRYCYYKETHKILGQTFGMCVLQVRKFASQTYFAPTDCCSERRHRAGSTAQV
jgi:N-acetyltransferase 10